MPHGLFDFSKLGKTPTCKHHASPNESPLHALLAQVQCTHARGIALRTRVHQRSPHSPPIVGQSWDLGVAHFSPFGNPKSGPEVQNGSFLMQKMIENGGGLPPVAGLGHLMDMWQGVHKWGFQPPSPRSARGLTHIQHASHAKYCAAR